MLGETIKGSDIGNHLWVVLSHPTADGMVAVANLTTHGRLPVCRTNECVLLDRDDHPFLTRTTCIMYQKAFLNPAEPLLRDKERGTLTQGQPFSSELLERVQKGALVSRFVARDVKDAIRASLA